MVGTTRSLNPSHNQSHGQSSPASVPQANPTNQLGGEDYVEQERLIRLVSNRNSFANQLLKNLITREFFCRCALTPSDVALTNIDELTLVDCQHASEPEIAAWLQHNLAMCHSVVLINLPDDRQYERLIEWPKINGMFYAHAKESAIIFGIRRILSGELWLPRRLLSAHLQHCRTAHPGIAHQPMTQRETDILRLLKRAATNEEISQQLGMKLNTVKSHLYKIYRKIGAGNRSEAGNWARVNID